MRADETHKRQRNYTKRQRGRSKRQHFEVPKIDALSLRLRSLYSKNSTNVAALPSIFVRSCSADNDTKSYLAGTDGPPQPGGLILPVQDFFNIRALESNLVEKGAGGSTLLYLRLVLLHR